MLDVVIPDGISHQATTLAEKYNFSLLDHSVADYDNLLTTLVSDSPGVEEEVAFQNVAKYLCGQHFKLGQPELKKRIATTVLAVVHLRNDRVVDVEDMANMPQGHLAKLKAGNVHDISPVQVCYLADTLKVSICLLFEDFSNSHEALKERLAALEQDDTAGVSDVMSISLTEAEEQVEVSDGAAESTAEVLVESTPAPQPESESVATPELDSKGSVLGAPLRIKISKVHPDPENPRQRFDQESLEELADSIQAKGQETPASVTADPDDPGTFMLVSGERRLRALNIIWQRLGGDVVTEPVIECFIKVIEGGSHGRLMHAFMENVQREDMPVLDTAAGLAKLYEGGESIPDLAKASGYSDSTVRNYINIHSLPDEVKALMEHHLPRRQQLNTTTAIDLLEVKSAAVQIELAREAVERQYGVAETRYLIQQRGGDGARSIIRSGHERSPSERYKGLARYIGRTTAWVRKFMQEGRDPIDDMFFHRDLELDDRAEKVKDINHLIGQLERLRDIVAKPPEK